jgi:hypothetical protein
VVLDEALKDDLSEVDISWVDRDDVVRYIKGCLINDAELFVHFMLASFEFAPSFIA